MLWGGFTYIYDLPSESKRSRWYTKVIDFLLMRTLNRSGIPLQTRGAIVNVGSLTSNIAIPNAAPYIMTKHGNSPPSPLSLLIILMIPSSRSRTHQSRRSRLRQRGNTHQLCRGGLRQDQTHRDFVEGGLSC